MSCNFIQTYISAALQALDPFWNKVVLLMHMENGNGAKPTDVKNHVNVGNALVTTSKKKFGNGSTYLNGNGSIIDITNSPDFDLTSKDFTIEAFFSIDALAAGGGALFGRWGIGGGNGCDYILAIYGSGSLDWEGGASVVTAGGVFPLNSTWHHVAVERYGSAINIFVDGVLVKSGAVSGALRNDGTRNFRVGRWDDGNSGIVGNVDELRFAVGEARYKGQNFSIPTAAYPDQ